MAEEPKPTVSKPTPLGVYDRSRSGGISDIELIALAISVIWLTGSAVLFLTLPAETEDAAEGSGGGTLRFLMTMLAIFLPVGMIWVAATAARASRVMREESHRLQAAIDAIRQSYIAQSQGGGLGPDPTIARRLEEIASSTRKTEAALAAMAEHPPQHAREAPPTSAQSGTAADDQPALALGTPAEEFGLPLASEDFIRALNFPETAEDKEGFAALRRALRDRTAAQLIQAAQDVLTLLSEDGIYMDDLRPDRARPETWRTFAEGTRGREVAALGGIRDRTSLALISARMKQDPIFRDAAPEVEEAGKRAADAAIQVLGGYGYTTDFAPQRFYRDAKLMEIGEGTSEIQRLVLGRELGL